MSRIRKATAKPMNANNQFKRPVAVKRSTKKPIMLKIMIFVYFANSAGDVFRNVLPAK
jgi:hypothetical protein